MNIIAAIDIKNGTCVRLLQGNFDRETVYSDDPVSIAKRWEDEGADMLHIVDLDGAKDGVMQHVRLINAIRQSVRIPIEVGGGIRDLQIMYQLLSIGVDRIVIGTIAGENIPLLQECIGRFGPAIMVAIDAKNGRVVTRGWQTKTSQSVDTLAQTLESAGVRRIMYTDVARDGMLTEPNYRAIRQLVKTVRIPVIAAGGISSYKAIKKMATIGVEGIIIGKALYEGTLQLKEVRACLQNA